MKKGLVGLCILFLFIVTFVFGCNISVTLTTSPPGATSSPKSTPASTSVSAITTTVLTRPAIASKNYANSQNHFDVEYPADWDLEEGLVGTIVMFAGPLANDYMTNINIVKEELPRKYSVEDYNRMGELQLKKTHSDYVKLQEINATISGIPAIVRTFTITVKNIVLKDKQVCFIKDKTAYIITYDVASDSHDKYIDSFNLALITFKFN